MDYALHIGCHWAVSSSDIVVADVKRVLGSLKNPLFAGRTGHSRFWLGCLLDPCLDRLQNVALIDQRVFPKLGPWVGL